VGERIGRYSRHFTVLFVFVAGGLLVGANSMEGAAQIAFVAGLCLSGFIVLLAAIMMRNAFSISLAMYLVLVLAGARLQSMEPRPKAALVLIAGGSVLAAIAFMISTVRRGRASTELELQLFSQSTSIAFFVTMIGAITYALLESWIDAPRLSMWVVWSVGMGSWALLSILLQRRYS
jgi:hypothetical protein